MRKLTRKEIREGLAQVPIETVLVGATKPGARALTAKQRKFAEAVAMGETKAGAYRAAYDTHTTPGAQSVEGRRLAANPRVALQIQAFQVAAEAKRYATPAALRSLVIEQLTAMAVDEDVKPAQRLRALELLGKVTEVAAFTERREVVTVTDAGAARDRLLDSLRSALRSDAIDAEVVGSTLLAELAGHDSEPGDTPHPASDATDEAGADPHPPESAGSPPPAIA